MVTFSRRKVQRMDVIFRLSYLSSLSFFPHEIQEQIYTVADSQKREKKISHGNRRRRRSRTTWKGRRETVGKRLRFADGQQRQKTWYPSGLSSDQQNGNKGNEEKKMDKGSSFPDSSSARHRECQAIWHHAAIPYDCWQDHGACHPRLYFMGGLAPLHHHHSSRSVCTRVIGALNRECRL